MNCEIKQESLSAYFDDALSAREKAALTAHLPQCSNCVRNLQRLEALRKEIRETYVPSLPPLYLESRIQATLLEGQRPPSLSRAVVLPSSWLKGWHSAGIAAAAAAGLMIAILVPKFSERLAGDSRDSQEVVSSHIRALMESHLTDVPSSDQHTVKPWFNGKLDFTFPVPDLKTDGFDLIGGRVDYIENQKVAAIVYRRRQHPINLFIWPLSRVSIPPAITAQRGYNLIHWTDFGMSFWAVSDLNRKELDLFVHHFEIAAKK